MAVHKTSVLLGDRNNTTLELCLLSETKPQGIKGAGK